MSLIKGKCTENNFINTLIKNCDNIEIKRPTNDEDMFEHWDVSANIKFDVKGVKKISRNDNQTNENIHYVEFKNVNGESGWLYGKADKFAFETDDYWIIVTKDKLQKFIHEKCKDKIMCERPELYKIYSRKNRKDKMTLVKTLDLMFLSDMVIVK